MRYFTRVKKYCTVCTFLFSVVIATKIKKTELRIVVQEYRNSVSMNMRRVNVNLCFVLFHISYGSTLFEALDSSVNRRFRLYKVRSYVDSIAATLWVLVYIPLNNSHVASWKEVVVYL